MMIPYPYNRTGAHAAVDAGAVLHERGAFTWLRNSSLHQKAMTIEDAFLTSSKVRSMAVCSDGKALHTTVHYSGSMTVSNGGIAEDTVVNSYGSIIVSAGGTIADTEVNAGGRVFASSGGVLSGGTVHSSGSVSLVSEASAYDITVENRGMLSGGNSNSFCSCTVSSGGYFYPGSNAKVTDLVVSLGAYVSCYSGVEISSVTVKSGGWLYLSSGCRCHDAVVESGGNIVPYICGHDEDTVVTGSNAYGSFSVCNGTAMNFTIAGATLQLYYYASAVSTVISSGGVLYVSYGANATGNTVCSSGRVYVYSGGTATETQISSGGSMILDFKGKMASGEISSGGYLSASNFGEISSVTLRGGAMYAYNGARVESLAIESSAYCSVGRAGLLTDVSVAARCSAYFNDYCSMTGCTAGGSVYFLNNGEYASITIASGGVGSASSYVAMTDLSVAESARMYLSHYTTATRVRVDSGGLLHVGSNASALEVVSAEGALISVNGGYVEYVTGN